MRRLILCLVLVLTALGACAQSADGWMPTRTDKLEDPRWVGNHMMKVIAMMQLPDFAGKMGPLMVVVRVGYQVFMITYLGAEIEIVELDADDWKIFMGVFE